MNEGQSFSFPSFDSYNYPSHKDLTFHQIEANTNSQYDLSKDSMIRNFPGKKFAMGQHLEIVLILQAAEIERLTINLQEYRTKFKRLSKNEKDFLSFQNQANELLHLKDELELKSRKMNSYVKSQEEEISDHSQYSKSLEGKYKRALKFIEEAHLVNHQLESVNQQLKDQIRKIEQTFEAFKSESIRQYQILRKELERKKNEQLLRSTNKHVEQKKNWDQIWSKEQKKFSEQKQRLQEALKRQQNKNVKLNPLVQQLSKEVLESQGVIESISQNARKSQEQKQETMTMIQAEIQRLNIVIREKVTQLKTAEQKLADTTQLLERRQTQINDLDRENIRVKQKSQLYEQQITKQNDEISKLSTYASNLATKVNEMGILIEEKNVEIRIKESKLHQEMENYSGVLSKSELAFNKEIERLKYANNNLVQEIERKSLEAANRDESYRQRQMSITAKLKQTEAEKQHFQEQIGNIQYKNRQLQESITQQNNALKSNLETMSKRIQSLLSQKRQHQQHSKRLHIEYGEGLKRSYEQKVSKLTERLSNSQDKINNLQEMKLSLQKTITYLKQSLQRSQRQKQQSTRNKAFEQMITEIEHLCQSTISKDNQILGLKEELSQIHMDLQKSIAEISSLKQLLFQIINNQNSTQSNRAASQIILLSKYNQSIQQLKLRLNDQQNLCESYRYKISQLMEMANAKETLICQLDNIKMENELYKREQEKNQKILYNYSQKVQILTAQFQRLEAIIEDLKIKNNELMTKNYNQTLNLEKNKITEQKIAVLSEQIERMSQQKINLTEEVSLCRMELSKDSLMDRQIQEQLSLFVLLFTEIEALRLRLANKERQIQDLRREQLSI